jgi:hypothetical protein
LLCPADLGDPDPARTLGDLLGAVGSKAFDRAPTLRNVEDTRQVIEAAIRDRMFRDPLLGPAARSCTWDMDTLPSRFIRAIVDERVRHRGGCSCGPRALSNKPLQRTGNRGK